MTTTLAQLELLAAAARPSSEWDWGTQRQIRAENRFHDALETVLSAATSQTIDDYYNFCLKATSEEQIDEGMKLARWMLSPIHVVDHFSGEVFTVEDNDHFQSVFPTRLASLSNLHTTEQDAWNWLLSVRAAEMNRKGLTP